MLAVASSHRRFTTHGMDAIDRRPHRSIDRMVRPQKLRVFDPRDGGVRALPIAFGRPRLIAPDFLDPRSDERNHWPLVHPGAVSATSSRMRRRSGDSNGRSDCRQECARIPRGFTPNRVHVVFKALDSLGTCSNHVDLRVSGADAL